MSIISDMQVNAPILANVRIVLVNPLYGGNVGSICRAMANMGLSSLTLVAPADLNMDEARMMAVAAKDILEARRVVATLEEAVGDCGLVVGTTVRAGLYRAHARTPREWAPRILEAASAGPVALVFGRENSGLMNEEIAICTNLIQIPSSSEYPSLNLAQAVMLCAYELFVASGTFVPPEEMSPECEAATREHMFKMWREMLLEIGFMQEHKADHMMLGLRRIFGRNPLSRDDVRIMMGVAHQMLWKARHSIPPGDAETGCRL
jgi:TrmH family RNA methyltransferase